MKSLKASRKCAKWLSYLLTIGWDKKHLDKLEELWWQWHDERTGELKNP